MRILLGCVVFTICIALIFINIYTAILGGVLLGGLACYGSMKIFKDEL